MPHFCIQTSMLIAGGYLEIAKVNVGVIKNIQIVQEGYLQRLSQIVKYRPNKPFKILLTCNWTVSRCQTKCNKCCSLSHPGC